MSSTAISNTIGNYLNHYHYIVALQIPLSLSSGVKNVDDWIAYLKTAKSSASLVSWSFNKERGDI